MTSPQSALISAIIPNFNHAQFIIEAVEGICNQSDNNFEVIIVDDGSTDNSRDIISRLAKQYNRIQAVYAPSNFGAVKASSIALSRSRGELIYQAAADDFVVNKDFFLQAREAFSRSPHIGVFFGKCLRIDSDTRTILGGMGYCHDGIVSPANFVNGFLNLSAPFFVPGASAILKRSAMDALGGYRAYLGPQIDYFLNHAIASKFGAYFYNEWVTAVREYKEKTSFSNSASLRDELMRAREFALEMSSICAPYSSVDQWNEWWKNRYARLVAKHYPFDALN